jgi:RNA polymerase sigma factor for flagellar operon FliA
VVAAAQTDTQSEALVAEALWSRWIHHHDAAARNQLVMTYAPIVKAVAARKVRGLPAHCELDDLVSAGLVALMAVVDRFDPTKGLTFEQYARMRISGAIIDELRRQDWAPRSLRHEERLIGAARKELHSRQGRAPTPAELASHLGLELRDLHRHFERHHQADLASLNAPTHCPEEAAPIELGDTLRNAAESLDPEKAALARDLSSAIRHAVDSLTEREQRILSLAIDDELHQNEIARILGISQSRVSQQLTDIRKKIQARIRAYDSGLRAA